MNPVDTVPLMLLALHMLALGVIAIIFLGMIALHRRARAQQQKTQTDDRLLSMDSKFAPHPMVWLAIRSSNLKAVQAALGVSCPAPCPWSEGIAGAHEFFIGSPLNGWTIVTGFSLPHPSHDVDLCFHFLVRLSRALNHVQFFLADPVSHHHAWAHVENGAVKRAYAWTGRTVWLQGAKTLAEMELNMKCFGYDEDAGSRDATRKHAAANVKKLPSLAARWGLDPMAIDENLRKPAGGIAGKSSLFYQD